MRHSTHANEGRSQLRDQLPLYPLHRSASNADQCCHLEDAVAGAQMPLDSLLDRRRGFFPCWRMRSRPARTLLRMIDLSCSPNTDAIWIMARPTGVVLSMACWSE